MRSLVSLFILTGFLIIPKFNLAASTTCEIGPDLDVNLDHLLNWCETHKIPAAVCDEFLDSASSLPQKDFKAKLFQHLNGHKESSHPAPIKTAKRPANEEIPASPSKAFALLQQFVETENAGFAKSITVSHKASKAYASLNQIEIRNSFEIIERMKNSKSRAELELFLKDKGGEYLSKLNNRLCSGKEVYSARLSLGSRICFKYENDSIEILCMGHGNTCYEH